MEKYEDCIIQITFPRDEIESKFRDLSVSRGSKKLNPPGIQVKDDIQACDYPGKKSKLFRLLISIFTCLATISFLSIKINNLNIYV